MTGMDDFYWLMMKLRLFITLVLGHGLATELYLLLLSLDHRLLTFTYTHQFSYCIIRESKNQILSVPKNLQTRALWLR